MYEMGKVSWLKHIDFLLLDLLGFQLVFLIAYYVRTGMDINIVLSHYSEIVEIFIVLHIVTALFFENYKNILKRGYYKEIKAIVLHVSIVVLGMFVYMFFQQVSDIFSRIFFLMMYILAIILITMLRLLWKSVILKKINNAERKRSLVLVSNLEGADKIIEKLEADIFRNYNISGLIVTEEFGDNEEVNGIPVIADINNALDYLKKAVVDEIFISYIETEKFNQEFVNDCISMGMVVHYNFTNISNIKGNIFIDQISDYRVLTTSIKIVTYKQMLVKRFLDIVGGLFGSFIAIGLMLVVVPIIKIQSSGPIFFVQERIGRNGRRFKMYKFRSMCINAEIMKKEFEKDNQVQGHMFKIKNDPRVFPFGRFMRKYSIDEFPQFFNVLKGEMSLVGTRPPTIDEYEKYEIHHKKRLAIKPGLTGLWQISGRSDIVDFEDVVKLDMEYITKWDFGLDIRILFKTIQVVFNRRGAF